MAVEIAKRFNGEVINADALQLYSALPIATNKMTVDEMQGVKHHLLGCVDPGQEWTVHDFVREAMRVIDDLHGREKVAVVVGGTHYYIQSLLWHDTIIPEFTSDDQIQQSALRDRVREELSGALADSDLHPLLKQVDPQMAERWHHTNTRKIHRSLTVFAESGILHSSLMREQEHTPKPRYKDSCVFWIHQDSDWLFPRLNARVDQMMYRGLRHELIDTYEMLERGACPWWSVESPSWVRGITQAIGLKEFHDAYRLGLLVDANSLKEGVELMKQATRKYCRKQVSWMKKNLSLQCDLAKDLVSLDQTNEQARIYTLDVGKDVSLWRDRVSDPAMNVVEALLHENSWAPQPPTITSPELLSILEESNQQRNIGKLTDWRTHHCGICDKTAHGQREWDVHLKSAKHKNQVKLRDSPQWAMRVYHLERKRQEALKEIKRNYHFDPKS